MRGGITCLASYPQRSAFARGGIAGYPAGLLTFEVPKMLPSTVEY